MSLNKLKILLSLLLLTGGSVAYCANAQADTQILEHKKEDKPQNKSENITIGEISKKGASLFKKYILTPIRNNPKTSAVVVVGVLIVVSYVGHKWYAPAPAPVSEVLVSAPVLVSPPAPVSERKKQQETQKIKNLNTRDSNGKTALIRAYKSGKMKAVLKLIKQGVDVNIPDNKGRTALILASGQGHKEIVQALIDAGADLDIQNKYDRTALILASDKGHTEIAQMLIEAGADINIQDNNGCTALIQASYNGHKEIAQALIGKGADLDIQNKYDQTALIIASGQGHTEIVQMLEVALEKQDTN